MIESGSNELSEDIILDAIRFGHKEMRVLIDLQEEIQKKCGRKKREVALDKVDDGLIKKVKGASTDKLDEINKLNTKEQREEAMDQLCEELIEKFVTEDSEYTDRDVKTAL